MDHAPSLDSYRLADRYSRDKGRVFLTGTQAIVRIVLDQAKRDQAAGLDTAGFVSGYRGSPLGGVDLELWRVQGADSRRTGSSSCPPSTRTSPQRPCWARSRSRPIPTGRSQGVFGLWYGKGPGVDRSGDALKHGNAYGSSPHGGVLVVAGDDHGCVSSSMPHQSDVAFMSWFMPTLHPASVAEYLEFGEYGYALSRFSGMWVGFKAVSEIVESGVSVELHPPRQLPASPTSRPPPGGLHYRWPDLPGPQIEERMEAKKHAVYAFAKANPIDRAHLRHPERDLRHRHRRQGPSRPDGGAAPHRPRRGRLPRASASTSTRSAWSGRSPCTTRWNSCRASARSSWSRRSAASSRASSRNTFYDYPGSQARAHGRQARRETASGSFPGPANCPRASSPVFLPDASTPSSPISVLRSACAALTPDPERTIAVPGATRTPYFCSGCPHNTSTKVPEGSKALAGIGCHFMASWMDRETSSLIQMGGEGVNWAASSSFTGQRPHLPEPRRRHLLSFRLHGDPAGHRGRRQHHLQDPVQRRGRHDGRPAGRRSGQRPCHRPQRAGGGRVAHRARLGSSARSSSPPTSAERRDDPPARGSRSRAEGAARDPRRHGADLRADLRHREAPPPQARADGGSRALRLSSTTSSARAAATARSPPTA